jgi:hypothetical protein
LANLTNVTELFLSRNQLDTNVTDAALLAWLNQPRDDSDDWRSQRGAASENRIYLPFLVRAVE